jgi:hypothetical protein
MNPGAFYQGQQMLDGGMRQGEADLQASQLKNLFDQQNNPQRLQAQSLDNQTAQARLPGIFADSDVKGMDRDKQSALQGDAIQNAKTKFAREASTAHLQELEDRAQEMAMSNDPAVRQQGEQLLMHHKDIIRDRAKQEAQGKRALELEQLRGTNQLALAGVNNSAGRYSKAGKGGGGSVEEQIASGKLSFEKAATLLAGAAFMAEQEGDTEKADQYRQMADDFNAKHIASKRAGAYGAAEGKPALDALGIRPNAPVPAESFPAVGRKLPMSQQIQQDIGAGAQFSSPEVEAKVRQAAGMSNDGATFKQAFGSYEPDKYEYRMGPNGVPQRKPKGK